jgi:predicted glycoside hydrolase/deacetylase ChbG (UPF0249 family)
VLIINADDFGASRRPTDAAVLMIEAGAVSSTTAMVWMRDSERAASIAVERRLAVGLHLNLTLPYSDRGVPAGERERQQRLTEILDRDSWWRAPNRLRGYHVGDVVNAQLERFRSRFGEPTHLDGHHHIHLHPDVLEELPALPIRPPLSKPEEFAETGPSDRRKLRGRFVTPDLCVAFELLASGTSTALAAVLAHARARPVEVMVHPQEEAQQSLLTSAWWRELIESVPTGSYRDLASADLESP